MSNPNPSEGDDTPPPPGPHTAPRPVVVQSLTPGVASSSVPIAPLGYDPYAPPAPYPAPPLAVPVDPQYYSDEAYAQQYEQAQAYQPPPPPPKRNFIVEYWRKVGGGSFTVSLIIHGLIIAAAIAWVSVQTYQSQVDFLPGGGSKSGTDANQEVAHQVQNKKRSSITKTSPMRKVVSQSSTATLSLPDTPIDDINIPEVSSIMGGTMGSAGMGQSGSGGGFGKGQGIGGAQGFTALPPTLKARCSSAERMSKLRESGGTTECEKAVSTALEYLKTKQKADGSWGTTNKGAMTGLALLCYLGRCETPESPFYGENVMKGIMYLVELSKKNPEGLMAQELKANYTPYEHGIATYALGEMYSLARLGGKQLPGMREAFEQGVNTIIKYQHEDGSWVYDGKGGYAPNGREDLSVTGWQYQALKAAKLSGLKFTNLHTSIDKVVKYLEKKQTKEGGIGAQNREGSYNQWDLTGTGVLGLQTLGHGKTTAIKKGIKFAFEMFQQEQPIAWKTAKLYDWYYYAQAFFQSGGPEWKFWNENMLPLILANQQKDGSWKSNNAGAGANMGGDNIYPTAQCVLMLEVYYRYLKVGDREEGSIFAR